VEAGDRLLGAALLGFLEGVLYKVVVKLCGSLGQSWGPVGRASVVSADSQSLRCKALCPQGGSAEPEAAQGPSSYRRMLQITPSPAQHSPPKQTQPHQAKPNPNPGLRS
jgi:hypothetical protein